MDTLLGATAPPDAASCALAGDYDINPGGTPFVWRFANNGTWVFASDEGGLATSTNTGTWVELSLDRVTLTDNFICPPGQEGDYDVVWNADCSSMTLAVVDDPCAARSDSLNGLQYDRRP